MKNIQEIAAVMRTQELQLQQMVVTADAQRKLKPTLAAQLHSFSGFFIFGFFQNIFGWGGAAPQTPQFWAVLGWGGKAPPEPPLKWSFVTFDRGSQTGPPRSNDLFFSAVDDKGAVDGTGAADDRPMTRSKLYLRRLQNAARNPDLEIGRRDSSIIWRRGRSG